MSLDRAGPTRPQGLGAALAVAALNAALGYVVLGLFAEVAATQLPPSLARHAPRLLYDVPLSVITRAGLADPLARLVEDGWHGRLLGGAAAPAVGCALVMLPFALTWATAVTVSALGRFRQRGP